MEQNKIDSGERCREMDEVVPKLCRLTRLAHVFSAFNSFGYLQYSGSGSLFQDILKHGITQTSDNRASLCKCLGACLSLAY